MMNDIDSASSTFPASGHHCRLLTHCRTRTQLKAKAVSMPRANMAAHSTLNRDMLANTPPSDTSIPDIANDNRISASAMIASRCWVHLTAWRKRPSPRYSLANFLLSGCAVILSSIWQSLKLQGKSVCRPVVVQYAELQYVAPDTAFEPRIGLQHIRHLGCLHLKRHVPFREGDPYPEQVGFVHDCCGRGNFHHTAWLQPQAGGDALLDAGCRQCGVDYRQCIYRR